MEEQVEVTAQAPVEVVDIQFRPGRRYIILTRRGFIAVPETM